MSWVPISFTTILVAATIALARFGGWSPATAGLAVAVAGLSFCAVLIGTALIFLPKQQRAEFLKTGWAVARRDLADIINTLTFRRWSERQ